ncbi:MAG: TlpA family protein disulfide reductase [Sphingomonadales bacterium]|nr:MAG: TlpA family protein disulfide reductase [Sphingomonadales bacterium]
MRYLSGFSKLLCLLALPLALTSAAPAPDKKPKIGQPAPEAEFFLVDGTRIKLSELRGEVVVINFWATWCVPCRTELPLLDTYYRLQKKHGMRVIAATTETSVPMYKLKPLFGMLEIQSTKKIKGPYAPIGNAVPTNYIIDRAGVVRFAKAGAFTLDTLNEEIVPLLKEQAP